MTAEVEDDAILGGHLPGAGRRSVWLGLSVVTAGAMLANLCGYLLHVPAARTLSQADYSSFAALLQVLLVLAVPALAIQVVIARGLVRGGSPVALRRAGWRVTGVAAAIAALAVPICVGFLHTPALATLAAAASAPALTLVAVEQGFLQGEARFGRLGALLGIAGLGKTVPAAVVLLAGGTVGPALLAVCGGTVAAALAGSLLVRSAAITEIGDDTAVVAQSRTELASVVFAAAHIQLVLIVLSSVDLFASRILLDDDAAGRYAVGAIATKMAFWAPQALGVVFFPALARAADTRRAASRLLIGLGACGAATVAGLALASPLLPSLLREDYRPVVGQLWMFGTLGALLAVLQGVLLAAIGQGRFRLALIAWAGLALEVAALAIFRPGTTTELVRLALVVIAATVTVGVFAVLRTGRFPHR